MEQLLMSSRHLFVDYLIFSDDIETVEVFFAMINPDEH